MTYPKSKFNEVAKWIQRYADSFKQNIEYDSKTCKKKADELMSTEGCKTSTSGTYRRVYQNSTSVIKFAIGPKGIDENAAEIRNETRISNVEVEDVIQGGTCSGDKYIASIIEYDVGSNRWIVMEKVDVTPDNVSHDVAKKIEDALNSAGIHIAEIEPVNMGRLDGRPVIFDYAGT